MTSNPQYGIIDLTKQKESQQKAMFEHNALIQKLSNYPRWTISSHDKIPLSMRNINPDDPNPQFQMYAHDNELITLPELNDIKALAGAVRTYRMNSIENNIIMIDIENHIDPAKKAELMHLPYGYGETSMSGGTHLLVEIPEKLVFNPKYLPVLMKNFARSEDWGFEVITNNHFMTFTKNEIAPNIGDENKLIALLDFLAENIVSKKTIQINETSDINMENVRLLAIQISLVVKNEISQLNFVKCNDSQRDWQASMKLAGHIYQLLNVPTNKILFSDITDSEIIEVIYKITSKRLDHRDKYDTYRDNLPFLKYVASNAWSYVLNHQ